MKRPYKEIPLIAMIILIQEYSKMVKDNYKFQEDLDQMLEELNIRFNIDKEDIKQITIEEYLRKREPAGKSQ